MDLSLSIIEREFIREKLISKSIVDETSGCWSGKWAKADGYCQIRFRRKTITAHRLAYLAFKGEIPEGLCVCHICNNRACVKSRASLSRYEFG